MFEDKIEKLNSDLSSVPPAFPEYEKRVYTVDEIQDILCISKSSAYNLVRSNAFHSVRVGGTYRISKKSFDAWLDQNTAVESQVCD